MRFDTHLGRVCRGRACPAQNWAHGQWNSQAEAAPLLGTSACRIWSSKFISRDVVLAVFLLGYNDVAGKSKTERPGGKEGA